MRWIAVAASLLFAGCSRDLSVPAPPGPGAIFGRVVVAVPGQAARAPAAGATVSLLSSSLFATAGENGAFALEGLTQASGQLLFRYDVDGDGSYRRQRLVSLAELNAGPGRQVSVGDVLVVENARLHGKALRNEIAGLGGGHGGSVAFVPEGPFTAYTADDGTFSFSELPPGTLQLALFRPGYQPATLDELTLRSGEDLSLREVRLVPVTGTPAPGGIAGRVAFIPDASPSGATVAATPVGGAPIAGSVSADGSLQVSPLPPGLYDLAVAQTGYSTAIIPNVLVLEGRQTVVREVVLGTGPVPDAGTRPPAPDGGAECGGACVSCGGTADCPSSQWCDQGLCREQCTAGGLGQCTNGRVCDPTTRTCVRPCGAGCPAGSVCEAAANACRQVCDGSHPCPSGFLCDGSSRCVPECTVTADCTRPRTLCQAGACVPDGTCAYDADCQISLMCTGGLCVPRPTALTDAGFACATPCDCRQGEVCQDGVCASEPSPTRFASAAADGGLGLTPQAPAAGLAQLAADAGAGAVLALRAGDTFALSAPLAITEPNVTVAGGYVVCGPNRWVRDWAKQSTVTAPGPTVVSVPGTATRLLPGVALRNLDVASTTNGGCDYGLVQGKLAPQLELSSVRGSFGASGGCGGSAVAVVRCNDCSDVYWSDVSFLAGPNLSSEASVAQLFTGSGTITGMKGTKSGQLSYYGVHVENLTGDTEISNSSFEGVVFSSRAAGIYVNNCGSAALTVRDNEISWGSGGGEFSGIHVLGCGHATLTGNTVDGRTLTGTVPTSSFGLRFNDSGAPTAGSLLDSNTVLFPAAVGNAVTIVGLALDGPRAGFTIENNGTSGGVGTNDFYAVRVQGVTSGPLLIRKNTFLAGPSPSGTGLRLSNVSGGAGLRVTDNVFKAPASGACGGAANGLWMSNSAGVIERTVFDVPSNGATYGANLDAAQLELYDSYFVAGKATGYYPCINGAAWSVGMLAGAGTQLWAIGNTLDGNGDFSQGPPSVGLICDNSAVALMTSNLIGGGQAPTHNMVQSNNGAGCLVPANFKKNYFWYARPGPRSDAAGGEAVSTVATAAPGTADGNGNIIGDAASCLDATAAQPTFKLASGSPCANRGATGARRDLSPITLDVEGKPRTAGAAPDIGCYEKE